MAKYKVVPKVLQWAREEVQLSIEEASVLLKIDAAELSAVEAGEVQPGLTLLRAMAKVYDVSLVALFLPEPLPPRETGQTDYRTVGGERVERLGYQATLAIRHALEQQEVASELLSSDPSLLTRKPIPEVSLSDEPAPFGRSIRAKIGLTDNKQLSFRDAADAFRWWRRQIEQLGVLVFQASMPRDECRGFSIWPSSDLIPAITINNEEVPQAKLFTLLHEFGHLCLRSPGICDETARRTALGRTEAWCNQAAAAALIPATAIELAARREWGRSPEAWTSADVAPVARRLRVSRPALALRLKELGSATQELYEQLQGTREQEDWRDREQERKAREGKKGFALPHIVRLAEVGHTYAGVVVRAWEKRSINIAEADALLRLGAKSFKKVVGEIADRSDRA